MTTLSAGIVLVRWYHGDAHYLLLRAYNYWDFPKGRVEPEESALATARREVAEETGLDDLEFRWGDRYRETAPYASAKVARYYLAVSAAGDVVLGINPELGRPEHHEYRWLTYSAAGGLLGRRVAAILDWASTTVESRVLVGGEDLPQRAV